MLVYFDCIAGIAGDMTLGALVDAGVPIEILQEAMDLLHLPGLSVQSETVTKNGFGATKVNVSADDREGHRHYSEIRRIIEASDISTTVQEKSLRIFHRLAEAESRIHRIENEDVLFHEVGAMDAIADIVGSVTGLEWLGVTRVVGSPLPMGTGFVRSAHGRQPVPAPATLELVRDLPVRGTGIEAELVTPTGAAILTTLADSFGPMPAMRQKAVGYGAGTWDLEIPNVLRLLLGESGETATLGEAGEETVERLVVVEANIDDMNPEFYEHVAEVLFGQGALDVFWTAVGMKKFRPGTLLSVLCRIEEKDVVVRTILRETTTLGVRWSSVDRLVAGRSEIVVHTAFGDVKIKMSSADGSAGCVSPEYEDCRRVAVEKRIPLWRVYQEALAAAREALPRAD